MTTPVPPHDLSAILERLKTFITSATRKSDDPQFVWYNKWRTVTHMMRDTPDAYGIETGRADHPTSIVQPSSGLSQANADALTHGHNALLPLLNLTATLEANRDRTPEELRDIVHTELDKIHATFADNDLFAWVKDERDL